MLCIIVIQYVLFISWMSHLVSGRSDMQYIPAIMTEN
jgi:hypothetical protein